MARRREGDREISQDWKTYFKCLTSLWFCYCLKWRKRLQPVCLMDERCHGREWSHQQINKEDFPESQWDHWWRLGIRWGLEHRLGVLQPWQVEEKKGFRWEPYVGYESGGSQESKSGVGLDSLDRQFAEQGRMSDVRWTIDVFFSFGRIITSWTYA